MQNNLNAILHYEGLRKQEVAYMLKMEANTFVDYTNGKHEPTIRRALYIANVLGYTAEEIWGNECPKEIIACYKEHLKNKNKQKVC